MEQIDDQTQDQGAGAAQGALDAQPQAHDAAGAEAGGNASQVGATDAQAVASSEAAAGASSDGQAEGLALLHTGADAAGAPVDGSPAADFEPGDVLTLHSDGDVVLHKQPPVGVDMGAPAGDANILAATPVELGYSSTLTVADIAEVCHEVNRGLCEAFGHPVAPVWHAAPPVMVDSSIKAVMFNLANPNATPESEHERWCSDLMSQGWAWGAVKDEAARTHHCLVPYSALPADQRAKDHAIKAVVNVLAYHLKPLSEAEIAAAADPAQSTSVELVEAPAESGEHADGAGDAPGQA